MINLHACSGGAAINNLAFNTGHNIAFRRPDRALAFYFLAAM
jgi:hypothetical protein